MKKAIVLLLTFAMLAALCGCIRPIPIHGVQASTEQTEPASQQHTQQTKPEPTAIATEAPLTLEEEAARNAGTCIGGDTLYFPGEEMISYDAGTHLIYYRNTLTVYLFSDWSAAEKEALAASVGGIVAGEIPKLNLLQIVLPETDAATLEALADQLMQQENVLYATCLTPMELSWNEAEGSKSEAKDTTNDPWSDEKDLNSATPGGNDWWAEAIGAYTAWKFSDRAGEVLVGIVDNGFDLGHEDLMRDNASALEMLNHNTPEEHGTHVTGLIAAQDNGKGIRGVADRAQIVCVDWEDSLPFRSDTTFTTTDTLEYLQALLSYSDERALPIVINNSWGIHTRTKDSYTTYLYEDENKNGVSDIKYLYEYFCVHATGAYDEYLEYLKLHEKRTAMESLLVIVQTLLRGKDDFLFVQSAGNGYKGKTLGLDSRQNGWFCGIDEELYDTLFSESVRETLAQHGVTYETVKEHILIVAAVDLPNQNGQYPLTTFSNYGETVDVCAPGQAIYSTIPQDSNGNRYGKLNGTSMAAPLVSGSAALVWSLDPTLKAKEVKARICGERIAVGVTEGDKGTLYPMLDVGAAATKTVVDYSVYLEAISRARSLSVYDSGEGYLYDLDGDGIDELFLIYCAEFSGSSDYSVPYSAYSVYTLNGSELVPLAENCQLRAQVGGGIDSIGVYRQQDRLCFASDINPEWDVGGEHDWKLYALQQQRLSLIAETKAAVQYTSESEIDQEASYAVINGERGAYSSYESWVQTLEPVFEMDGYDFSFQTDSGIPYDELIRMIRDRCGTEGSAQQPAMREDDEKAMYSEYILSGGCEDSIGQMTEYLDDGYAQDPVIKSILVDMNHDGIRECLVFFPEPWGFVESAGAYYLLTISDGAVKELFSGYNPGGNSMWAEISLERDTQSGELVIEYSDHWRDGVYAGGTSTQIYAFTDDGFACTLNCGSARFAKPEYSASNKDVIEKVKAETDMYYEDESDLWFYQQGEEYISKERCESLLEQYASVRDEYSFVEGTIDAPIP